MIIVVATCQMITNDKHGHSRNFATSQCQGRAGFGGG